MALKPSKISILGWKKILSRVRTQVSENHIGIISAGVAFYAFLSIFPAIAAIISIYGLAMDPQTFQERLSQLYSIMPLQTYEILKDQIEKLMKTSESALSWSMIGGVILSIWSANKGTKSLFTGLDIAYDTINTRGFIKQNLRTLLFTFLSVFLVIMSMILVAVFPALVDLFGLTVKIENIMNWGRWVLLFFLVIWFLGILYKYAPDRHSSGFRTRIPGSFLSTLLWLLMSKGFSYYVSNFGSYGEVYGSISAVVVMLLWLYISSFIILLGAELNSEIEKFQNPNNNQGTRL